MPEYVLKGPNDQRLKLTVPDGTSQDDIASNFPGVLAAAGFKEAAPPTAADKAGELWDSIKHNVIPQSLQGPTHEEWQAFHRHESEVGPRGYYGPTPDQNAKTAAAFFGPMELGSMLPLGAMGAGVKAGARATEEATQPLLRNVLTRGRSGRPNETAALPIGNEQGILERGEQRLGEGPRVVAERKTRDAILRKNWEEYGPEKDFDHIPQKVWEFEEKKWNVEHPDNQVGDRIPTTHPFMRYLDDRHLQGQSAPYPGAAKANEYFADDGRHELTAYGSARQIPEELRPSSTVLGAYQAQSNRNVLGHGALDPGAKDDVLK